MENFKPKVTDIFSNPKLSKENKLQDLCNLLRQEVAHYDWVGFYFHKKDEQKIFWYRWHSWSCR